MEDFHWFQDMNNKVGFVGLQIHGSKFHSSSQSQQLLNSSHKSIIGETVVTSSVAVTNVSNISQVMVHDKLQQQQEVSASPDEREEVNWFKISVPIQHNNGKHYE